MDTPLGAPDKLFVSWDELDRLVAQLADQVGDGWEVILVIARGGLVPAGMLAYRLGIRQILVAGVEYYNDAGGTLAAPVFHGFPAAELLRDRRTLVVDEVWETGSTMAAVAARIRDAGGTATTAVLHWKPDRSRVAGRPDHYVETTDLWVVYPYKPGG